MTIRTKNSDRLIFVCQVFYPDTSSTSQLFTTLLRNLSMRGVNIEVFCGYSGQTDEAIKTNTDALGNIRIRRCGLPIQYRKNMFYRGISYTTFLLQLATRLLMVGKQNVVFGVTNPPFVAGVLWLTSRIRRFRYQYMILDAYPEGLIALGKLGANGIVSTLWFGMNRLAYRACEEMVVLGRDMIPMLQANYDVSPKNISYIPHWSAVEITAPKLRQESTLLKRLNLEEKFVVQYSGNMGIWHDMETFVKAADKLRDVADIHFLFVGNGVRRTDAEALSRKLNLDNITWHDFVPISELEDSLSSCNCALISQNHGLEGVAVPCKLYGILASGRAILAQVPDACEVALVVKEEACGIVVEPGNAAALVSAIKQLFEGSALAEVMGENAFNAYRSKYRLEQAISAFSTLWNVPAKPDDILSIDGQTDLT